MKRKLASLLAALTLRSVAKTDFGNSVQSSCGGAWRGTRWCSSPQQLIPGYWRELEQCRPRIGTVDGESTSVQENEVFPLCVQLDAVSHAIEDAVLGLVDHQRGFASHVFVCSAVQGHRHVVRLQTVVQLLRRCRHGERIAFHDFSCHIHKLCLHLRCWHDTTQFLCAWPLSLTVKELLSISRWLKDAQNMFALDANFVYMLAEQWLGRGERPVTRQDTKQE